ncbi:MAG TPA: hypothetical protein VIH17_03920 [Candidatus Acidoferrales bacterium]
MLQMILLAAFSLLVVVACLAGLVWVIFTGSMRGMDGILLTAICLLVGLIFSLNLVGVLRQGRLLDVVKMRRLKDRPEDKQTMGQGGTK